MEKTYNELRFNDVPKKHFSEMKNTVGSAGRLRLVVCKTINEELIKISRSGSDRKTGGAMGRRLRFVCQLQSSGDVRASRITFQAGCEEIDLGLYLIEEGESRDAETWE